MEYTTTISSKGQITLPADIRRSLNIKKGDRLKVVKKGQTVSIMPDTYEEELAELRAQAQAHLKKHGMYGLSWEEIRNRAEQAKVEEYVQKYGPRT